MGEVCGAERAQVDPAIGPPQRLGRFGHLLRPHREDEQDPREPPAGVLQQLQRGAVHLVKILDGDHRGRGQQLVEQSQQQILGGARPVLADDDPGVVGLAEPGREHRLQKGRQPGVAPGPGEGLGQLLAQAGGIAQGQAGEQRLRHRPPGEIGDPALGSERLPLSIGQAPPLRRRPHRPQQRGLSHACRRVDQQDAAATAGQIVEAGQGGVELRLAADELGIGGR